MTGEGVVEREVRHGESGRDAETRRNLRWIKPAQLPLASYLRSPRGIVAKGGAACSCSIVQCKIRRVRPFCSLLLSGIALDVPGGRPKRAQIDIGFLQWASRLCPRQNASECGRFGSLVSGATFG
jgi:hypothetical protein